MKWDSDLDKISLPEFDYKSDQTLDDFVKATMEEQLGLIENPTQKDLAKIIHRKKRKKPKSQTVYFRDVVGKITEDPDDISDAEIINEFIRDRIKNQKL